MEKLPQVIFMLGLFLFPFAFAGHDYGQALSKSIMFFEAQRSGYLPHNQRVSWRSHSGLQDGKASGVDLVGGYYDAGDNVKFGLPMAFTVTMMSWSIIEYGKQMASSGELGHAMEAVKWGTDYFIKAHPEPNVLYGEVGDGNTDHKCWQRPEDMTTDRHAYKIDPSNPGSDLAGETAAAMAAASIVFRRSNPAYSHELLSHAYQIHITKKRNFVTQLCHFTGHTVGATEPSFWSKLTFNSTSGLIRNHQFVSVFLLLTRTITWDVKYPGVQTLVAKFLLQGKAGIHAPVFERYLEKSEYFMCSCMGRGTHNVQRTPGGLIYRQRWNNLQFATSSSFLATVYSDYLASSARDLKCASGYVAPSQLLSFAKSQVDYILGDNPRATSYMVGYGNNFPQRVHHRGSSIVSIKANPSFVSCMGGYDTWFSSKRSNTNILTGAIVGGPDAYDDFADERKNYEQTEPATYNNAPLIGVLARLGAGHGGYNQLLPASWSGPISVEQKMTHSWVANGITYYRYSTTVTNKSNKILKSLNLSISKLYGPIWGLTKSGDSYTFPAWINSLSAGKSLEFVYIHSTSPADVSVANYLLA
ncbi:hypothetical protein RYX36_033548 [Vicia faba]